MDAPSATPSPGSAGADPGIADIDGAGHLDGDDPTPLNPNVPGVFEQPK